MPDEQYYNRPMTIPEAKQALGFVNTTLIKVNREHARLKLVVQVYDLMADIDTVSAFSRSIQKEQFRRVEDDIVRLRSRLRHYKRVLMDYLDQSDKN